MYRGFNFTFPQLSEEDLSKLRNDQWKRYVKTGSSIYLAQKNMVRAQLDSFLKINGRLNAKEILEDWFPQVKADVFLSHSHRDEEIAFYIAGMLKEGFDLDTFIDSGAWGHANKLLNIIDEKYCLNQGGETYSYRMRNYSTSHVHMMLGIALMKMIDNSECLIFLNSPNSISAKGTVQGETASPWIYSEIVMSSLLREKIPTRLKLTRLLEKKKTYDHLKKSLEIDHEVDLSHLTALTLNDIKDWVDNYDLKSHPLDVLYKLKPKS